MATVDNWDSNAYDMGSHMQNFCANKILAEYAFGDNLNILDLGCGDGKNTANILNYAPTATILGIDRSPQMITSAKAKYATAFLSFEQKDITHLDIHKKFDLVVTFFCLDWIKDQLSLQQKIYQSLKPKGRTLYVISTGKDDVAKIVEAVAKGEKWALILKDHSIPAGLHKAEDYRSFMEQAGLTISAFDVIHIPVELPHVDLFYQFIAALPLFADILTAEKNDEIARDITIAFQKHCEEKYQGKLICVGEMIIAKAYRA